MRSRLAIEPGGVWVRVPIKTVCLSVSVESIDISKTIVKEKMIKEGDDQENVRAQN